MKPVRPYKQNKQFTIHFAGLNRGEHVFKYDISDTFFKPLQFSEIRKGQIHLLLKLNRQDLTLILDFDFSGSINLPCDRCGDAFDIPVEGTQQLIVNLGGEKSDEGDELLVLPETEGEIDLTQYIYEYITLLVPQKRTHATKQQCNKEVIKKLKTLEANVKNEADPRWEKLREIKFN